MRNQHRKLPVITIFISGIFRPAAALPIRLALDALIPSLPFSFQTKTLGYPANIILPFIICLSAASPNRLFINRELFAELYDILAYIIRFGVEFGHGHLD